MKAYEIIERDILHTKLGKRFHLKDEQVKEHRIYIPDEDLKSEFETLGLYALEIWIDMEFIEVSMYSHSDLIGEPVIAENSLVFKILNSDSVSEFAFNYVTFGLSETEYDNRCKECECKHEHSDAVTKGHKKLPNEVN